MPSRCPADVPDTGKNLESSSWTSLLTQSMSILGGGYGNKNFSENNDSNLSVLNSTDLLNNDKSFESYLTPPSSPCAVVSGEVSEVFVTPPPSPPAMGVSLGSSIQTAPNTSTLRPRLSDVFTARVPDVPSVDPGRVRMPSASPGQGPAPAGLSVNLVDFDFIQINCGKRISAMALLETNVKNKIALIQEPYTSINGCTLIHKRDFFSSGTAPQGATDPNILWTSLRPRAAIYAPGRSDVLPVYRFMTRDVATVAVGLGFVSSVYMDITKTFALLN
jgi:hypothetical protein